jgi:hypothetical protein
MLGSACSETIQGRGAARAEGMEYNSMQIGHGLNHRTAVIDVEARQLPEDGVALLAARMAERLAAGHHLVGDSAEPLGGADAHGSLVHPRGHPPLLECRDYRGLDEHPRAGKKAP